MRYLQTIVAVGILALGTACSNPKQENNMETVPVISDFPTGEENTAFAQY